MPFWIALSLVFLAEMGDKSQLLVVALATRFKFWDVFMGLLFASLVTHGLAVFVGSALSTRIQMHYVQLMAATLFVVFALWSLYVSEEETTTLVGKWGPMATVFATFFISELGDKTQLTSVALAVRYQSPILIWLGATFGMVVADSMGLVVGKTVLCHLKMNWIKLGAASIFMLVGLSTFASLLHGYDMVAWLEGLVYIVIAASLIGFFLLVRPIVKEIRQH